MFNRKIVRFLVFSFIFFFVASFLYIWASTVNAQSSGASDAWPMFRHDLQRTGYSTSNAPNTNGTSWIYNGSSEFISSPAIADGRLIVAQSNGDILAININTGTPMWTCKTDAAADLFWSSPAIDSGMVYIGAPDCNLYCLDEATGFVKWTYRTGGAVDSSPLVKDGKVYFTSEDGRLYCLDSTTGAVNWKSQVLSSSGILSSPAYANNLFYVTCNNGMVYAFKELNGNGTIRWATSIGAPISSSPSVSYNNLYFGTGANVFGNGTNILGKIMCLNASSPRVMWSTSTNENNLDIFHSSPALADGKLFIGSNAGNLFCLDASTGTTLWYVNTGRQILGSPAVADNKVFFGCGDSGEIYCANENTGTVIWSYRTGSRSISSPVVYDGVVYACAGTSIYSFGSPNPTPTSTSAPVFANPTPTISPQTSSSTIISAKTDRGTTINLTISGNITGSQMSNLAITTDESAKTTKVSFEVTGENGTAGFSNVTIPINTVHYGATPITYIDDQPAENQGYTQDDNNYYVWYTTHFSVHKVSILFSAASSSSPTPLASNNPIEVQSSWLPVIQGVAIAIAIVGIVVVALKLFIRGKGANTR